MLKQLNNYASIQKVFDAIQKKLAISKFATNDITANQDLFSSRMFANDKENGKDKQSSDFDDIKIYHIELASFSEEYLKNLETLMKLKEGQNTICEYELVTSDYEDLVRFISQAEELQDQMSHISQSKLDEECLKKYNEIQTFLDTLKQNNLYSSLRSIVNYGVKILVKLENLRLLAIELFDKAIHDKVIRSSRRQTERRESMDLDEQFKFNDSSYKDAEKHHESFLPSMTHKERSLKFSAALSKIPEKKMSNISIMDFKDLLSASHKGHRFRLNSNNDGLVNGMSLKKDIDPFDSDYKEQDNESGSKIHTQRDSLSRSSDRDRPSYLINKESIFTPNMPITREEKRGYCCTLI